MSWNPLKKLSKTSHGLSAEKNVKLEREITRLNQTDVNSKKLCKEAKKLSDCILAVNRYENKMTNDLSNSVLCQENEKLRNVVQEWHGFNCETDKSGEDFVCTVRQVVVEPLKKLQKAYDEVKSELKKCDQMQHDCIKYQQKVNKYSEKEKTPQNIVKLEAARTNLLTAENDYRQQVDVLCRELPLFVDSRVDYFQPSLAALIRAKTQFWGDNVKSFADHSNMIGEANESPQDYAKIQAQRFAEINSLSIVAEQTKSN